MRPAGGLEGPQQTLSVPLSLIYHQNHQHQWLPNQIPAGSNMWHKLFLYHSLSSTSFTEVLRQILIFVTGTCGALTCARLTRGASTPDVGPIVNQRTLFKLSPSPQICRWRPQTKKVKKKTLKVVKGIWWQVTDKWSIYRLVLRCIFGKIRIPARVLDCRSRLALDLVNDIESPLGLRKALMT
jgi:IS1 family transposase